MNCFDADRLKRWIDASHRLSRYDVWLITTVQGLGKLDVNLLRDHAYIIENLGSISPITALSDQVTLSYLWVLGSYELIRTLDQRVKEQSNAEKKAKRKKPINYE